MRQRGIIFEMDNTQPENCQKCFRPPADPAVPPKTQWVSVCRCDRPYSPKAQFSIDVCGNCRRRIPPTIEGQVERIDLCTCPQPNAQKVQTHIKPNEQDAVALDPVSLGISQGSFPIERYAPIALLGQSSRASVILARDKQRGTKVAVKCFKKVDPALQAAFQSEVKKNQQLNHTNVVRIVDSGFPSGKTPYLVTEYKDGLNIEQWLALHGTPSPDVVVKILMGVCEALLYAQKQGVLHKDIKPGNVIFFDDMNSEPLVLVTDFALPKVKASEGLADSADAIYMTADEARNVDYNEKSEVYAIGTIGYALITGRPPFKDGSFLDIKNAHALKLPPKISDLKFDNKRPRDLDEVIEKCLEKDPGNRFESVAKLYERLEVFPKRVQMQIVAIAAAEKKKKMMLIGAAVGILVALCVAGFLAMGHR